MKKVIDHDTVSVTVFAVLAAAAMMILGVKGSIGMLVGEFVTIGLTCSLLNKKKADDLTLAVTENPTDTTSQSKSSE